MRYNAGKYRFKESAVGSFVNRFVEYLQGVTLARQSINRLKPAIVEKMKGDILEIGGYENFFKKSYKSGRFLNLDLTPKDGVVDIVGDAEALSSLVEEGSLGGVFCISVIEHTLHPEKIIEEIYKALKPGGLAFISSPWLFETHMEPRDYLRFSKYRAEIDFEPFEILDVDYTNSYSGLLAHVMQYHGVLRFLLGWIFFLLDSLSENDPRWATQISYTLRKREG